MERVQVGIVVERHVYEALKARSAVMNMKPADFARRLFEAAWSARGGQEAGIQAADMDLGLQIRLVFALSGDGDIPGIARATKLPERLVRDILAGFRQVAEERREAREAGAVVVRAGGEAPPSVSGFARAGASHGSRPSFGPPLEGVEDRSEAAAGDAEARKGARGQRYSAEEIETVRTMWAAGATIREIAAAIGRTSRTLEVWAGNHRDVCPRRRG